MEEHNRTTSREIFRRFALKLEFSSKVWIFGPIHNTNNVNAYQHNMQTKSLKIFNLGENIGPLWWSNYVITPIQGDYVIPPP